MLFRSWSMWFNSMQHEEPYQGLTCREGERNLSVSCPWTLTRTQVVHGCRQLVMRIVLLSQITSATLMIRSESFGLSCQIRLLVRNQRKVRMMSSQHAPYALGYTRATMANTKRCKGATPSQPQKIGLSSDCRLQLACMKVESLVIAGQLYGGESVPGLCTHRPSHHGS